MLCVGQRLCLWAPMKFKCHGMARGLRHGAHGAHGGHVWQTDSEKRPIVCRIYLARVSIPCDKVLVNMQRNSLHRLLQ